MKPTSRCIDIRQEHPLLEHFKERFSECSNFKNPNNYNYCGGGDDWFWCGVFDFHGTDITLDQRRERRGKEYYGETRK